MIATAVVPEIIVDRKEAKATEAEETKTAEIDNGLPWMVETEDIDAEEGDMETDAEYEGRPALAHCIASIGSCLPFA
jgi:hypothetical protein